MGVQTTLVPFRFITMLGHFLAALLVFFSYVRAALLSLPSLAFACLHSLLRRRAWQRDNVVVAMRFEYTDADYNFASSSMLAVTILTFVCIAVQAHGEPAASRRGPRPRAEPGSPRAAGIWLLWWLHHVRHRDEPVSCAAATAALTHRQRRPCACCHTPRLGARTRTDCCCHVAASMLLAFFVIQKWHYVSAWYVFGFLGCAARPQQRARRATVLAAVPARALPRSGPSALMLNSGRTPSCSRQRAARSV